MVVNGGGRTLSDEEDNGAQYYRGLPSYQYHTMAFGTTSYLKKGDTISLYSKVADGQNYYYYSATSEGSFSCVLLISA